MNRLLAGFTGLAFVLAGGSALAADPSAKADSARPHAVHADKEHKSAARPNISAADRKAMAAEEKDRLAREKKELTERQKLLEGQLATSQKLVAEKDVLIKQMQDEIAALKAGKPVPAAAAASADQTPAKPKPAK